MAPIVGGSPERIRTALAAGLTSRGGPRRVANTDLGVHDADVTTPDWSTRLETSLTETARIADQGGVWENMGGPPEPTLLRHHCDVVEQVVPRLADI